MHIRMQLLAVMLQLNQVIEWLNSEEMAPETLMRVGVFIVQIGKLAQTTLKIINAPTQLHPNIIEGKCIFL